MTVAALLYFQTGSCLYVLVPQPRTNTLGLLYGSHYPPLPSASSDRTAFVSLLSSIAHRSALSETCEASSNSQSLRSAPTVRALLPRSARLRR
jgi:hypothetical protein